MTYSSSEAYAPVSASGCTRFKWYLPSHTRAIFRNFWAVHDPTTTKEYMHAIWVREREFIFKSGTCFHHFRMHQMSEANPAWIGTESCFPAAANWAIGTSKFKLPEINGFLSSHVYSVYYVWLRHPSERIGYSLWYDRYSCPLSVDRAPPDLRRSHHLLQPWIL